MRFRKQDPTKSIANVARQLQYALEQTSTIDEAFKTLYAAAEPSQHEDLRQLESLVRSPPSDGPVVGPLRRSAYPQLSWLLHQTLSPERSAAALFREYQRHESFSTTTIVAVWSEFSGFLTYLGAVLAVLVLVVSMYGVFVLPQIRGLYSSFGTELPTVTRIAFGHGVSLSMLLLAAAAGFLIFLTWFVFLLRRRLRRYLPLEPAYQRIPIVGPVVVAYHQYLWLSYAGLLRASGLPIGDALRVAGTRVPLAQAKAWVAPGAASAGTETGGPTAIVSDLNTAARLGRLHEEAQYQQEATADTFLNELSRCRRRSRIILTICVYYLVANFVSAMYLPIFSLGSAI